MPTPFSLTLTAEQREEFDAAGVLVLPGYFPARDMAALADAVWSDISRRFGIERRRPETWTVERPGKFQSLVRSGGLRAFGSDRLFAIGDLFLGAGKWIRPRPHQIGAPLVTFPMRTSWEVPHKLWHLDTSASDCIASLPGIRVFTFLEPSLPRGGGTPYIAGSHRLALEIAARTPGAHLHSQDLRAILAQEHPWFAALFEEGGPDRVQRFMIDGARIGGTDVRVHEMLGQPGDAIIVHPAVFHSIAVNALDSPRMMLMQFLFAESYMAQLA